jgi:hypothetical protein
MLKLGRVMWDSHLAQALSSGIRHYQELLSSHHHHLLPLHVKSTIKQLKRHYHPARQLQLLLLLARNQQLDPFLLDLV